MWTRAELKANAKARLSRHHWYAVLVLLVGLLLGVSEGVSSSFSFEMDEETFQMYFGDLLSNLSPEAYASIMSVLSTVLLGLSLFSILYTILVSYPASIGVKRYFLSAREVKTPFSEMFSGFRMNYINAVLVSFMQTLFIFLWFLLFVIPGVIKAYSYRMVPYLLAENPNMDYRRALQLSSAMMDGHKLESFVLDLSFIGWAILSAFTAGILGVLYVNPYMASTNVELYVAIRSEAFAKQLTGPEELPFMFT